MLLTPGRVRMVYWKRQWGDEHSQATLGQRKVHRYNICPDKAVLHTSKAFKKSSDLELERLVFSMFLCVGMKNRAACLKLCVPLWAREGSFLVSLSVQALEVVQYQLQMNKINEKRPTNKPITQSERKQKRNKQSKKESKQERKQARKKERKSNKKQHHGKICWKKSDRNSQNKTTNTTTKLKERAKRKK